MFKDLMKIVRRYPQICFLAFSLIVGIIAVQFLNDPPCPAPNAPSDMSAVSNQLAILSDDPQLVSAMRDALDESEKQQNYENQSLIPCDDPSGHYNAPLNELQKCFADRVIISGAETTDAELAAVSSGASGAKPLLDIPLAAEAQQRIFGEVCYGNWQDFCLLMAVGYKETNGTFLTDQIGDQGLSYGLFQINTKWHTGRVTELGYTLDDLFDPVICAEVALDYLHELMDNYQGQREVTNYIFMLYNMGPGGANNAVKHSVRSTEYSRLAMSCYENYLAQTGLA